jgi:hypothetical protein
MWMKAYSSQETIQHTPTMYSVIHTKTMVHAQIINFKYWRWDQTPLSTIENQGILVDVEHPQLAKQDSQDQVSHIILEHGLDFANAYQDAFYRYPIETALMRVNKNMHAELIDTMFANNEVEFGYQLSDKSIHFSEPKATWTFGNQLNV